MYNLQFKDIKTSINIPSIKIDSKQVYNDIDGSTILIDESFSNFILQIYKAIPSGTRKVDNYNRCEIENKQCNGKDHINNYWLHIKRNGKHKGV